MHRTHFAIWASTPEDQTVGSVLLVERNYESRGKAQERATQNPLLPGTAPNLPDTVFSNDLTKTLTIVADARPLSNESALCVPRKQQLETQTVWNNPI
jgi:hypothetical protein